MVWKLTKSNGLKPIQEGWFISWRNGKDEIEIIRYYNEELNKWVGFEVWHQRENKDKDSWEGTHLRTYKSEKEAIKFAKRYIQNNKRKVINERRN